MEKLKTAAVEANQTNVGESVAVHVCTMCGGIFKSKVSLKTNINVKHKKTKEGHLYCEQCDFKTKHKNQLTKHIQWHIKIRHYCPVTSVLSPATPIVGLEGIK